jgi:CTP synthase
VLAKIKVHTKEEPDLEQWKDFLGKLKNPTEEVTIGLVGKYVSLPDAYKSIVESFVHAGSQNDCRVNLKWISSEDINKESVAAVLNGLDGVLVAPGFGERGMEGKIEAIKYIRENKIPFFGICLGMQCAVIEFSRNVSSPGCQFNGTHTENQTSGDRPDGRAEKRSPQKAEPCDLGAYACKLKKGSKAYSVYGESMIQERHRHRYEFNNKYLEAIEEAGMKAVGINPDSNLVEIVELKDHPWFIGVQFHPELRSTVMNPHPLFVKFIEAAIEFKKSKV